MDVAAARRALATAGFSATRIEPILGGWASWTFELDGELIVRFPRTDEVVEAMHREMRLLPALAEWVSFRVPMPLYVTDDWFVYEKIPGREFEKGDDAVGVLAMIDELHSFPVERATALLQRPAWGWYLHDQWPIFEAAVLPLSEAYPVAAEGLGDRVKADKGVGDGVWFDRLVQVGITMTPDVARSIAEWLVKRADEAERFASRGTE